MSKHQQILSELTKFVGSKREFDFMNTYKGMPLVYKGKLQEIKADTAIFLIRPPDSICLTWNKNTHIIDNRLYSGVKAEVLDFNIDTGIATVGNFSYTEHGFGDRTTVRVEPDTHIDVQISWDKTHIKGVIVDISLTGFGIQAKFTKKTELPPNTLVNLKFQLSDHKVEIPGKVVSVFESEGAHRLAIQFEENVSEYATIAQYIRQRRADLRQEIQDKYDQTIKSS